MFDAENDEKALADRFKGDPGVHVNATGRVVPRKCELCSGFFMPADPMNHWKGGVLPEQLRAPVLAAEIASIWAGQLPNTILDKVNNGYVPIHLLWKEVNDEARNIESNRQKTEAHKGQIVTNYSAQIEKIKRENKGGIEKQMNALNETASNERHAADRESMTFTSEERKKALMYKQILIYSLQHYGECWKSHGSRTALAHADTFAELRNRRTDWCDAGELRGDVEPDQNRDMTPCMPRPPGSKNSV